jgi:hypothetical protein
MEYTKRDMSLNDAKDLWADAIYSEGAHCPCCKRWGKVYTRRLNRAMCEALSWLGAQELRDGWIDVPNRAPKWLLRTNQLASLRWWDLVVRRHGSDDPKKKHTGEWKVTNKGREFLVGFKVPESVSTYDGDVVRVASELISFDEVHNSFDYSEVMNG